jgi:hypothetical protein
MRIGLLASNASLAEYFTTAGRDAVILAQAAFPALCLRQLPLPLSSLLALILAQRPSVSSAALSSSE